MNFEEILQHEIRETQDSTVRDAMEYSLMAGGKRIRPVLLYEVLKGYGIDPALGDHFASAIEMIHTYSLIHDDLPAMDNDDLRRGKPTCHKQFDEATAILAGDGLLTYAFEEAAKTNAEPSLVLEGIRILSQMAGPEGMVYGQCLDMAEETGRTDWDALKKVHKYKTGCLLSAPLMIGAVLSGHREETAAWHEAGDLIGLAFQVQDDVLDATKTADELGKSNSDERNEKVTSVSLMGIDEAVKTMNELYDLAADKIRGFRDFSSVSLIGVLKGIQSRSK